MTLWRVTVRGQSRFHPLPQAGPGPRAPALTSSSPLHWPRTQNNANPPRLASAWHPQAWLALAQAPAVTTVGTASGVTRSFNSGVLFQGIAGSDGLPGDKGELVSVSAAPSLPPPPGKGPAVLRARPWRQHPRAPARRPAGPVLPRGPGRGVLAPRPATRPAWSGHLGFGVNWSPLSFNGKTDSAELRCRFGPQRWVGGQIPASGAKGSGPAMRPGDRLSGAHVARAPSSASQASFASEGHGSRPAVTPWECVCVGTCALWRIPRQS